MSGKKISKAASKRKIESTAPEAQTKSTKLESPISELLFTEYETQRLKAYHDASAPYKHVFIDGICERSRMIHVQEEVKNNMTTTFKESDLFKVFQTVDLSNLNAESSNIPQLVALREGLYSKEFRKLVSDITGCGDLSDRIDLSINAYTQGCHLLCHDDVISTRKISYIIYIADPEDDWEVADGGLLELYPVDPKTQVDMGAEIGIQGVPMSVPTNFLVPKFNTMAFFIVQPGRSYHAVQEVFAEKPRVSISGWYHGECPPPGSDMASLGQIMKRGEEVVAYNPIKYDAESEAVSANACLSDDKPKDKKRKKGSLKKKMALSNSDLQYLHEYLNPEYLKPTVVKEINRVFCDDSSIQLKDFLRPDIAEKLRLLMISSDEELLLGSGRRPEHYELGVGADWELVGPPHLRRHLKAVDSAVVTDEIAQTLVSVRKLLESSSFAKYLFAITSLPLLESASEVRRFRPGLDYTVAHYGSLTSVPKLDATLCFVLSSLSMKNSENGYSIPTADSENVTDAANKESDSESDEDDDNEDDASNAQESDNEDDQEVDDDEDSEDEEEDVDEEGRDLWSSGDVGGFECYIEADDESADASEVYMTANKQEKDTSLLSVSAGFNVLNVVLRDERVMRFVKYVSAQAPSSRWDVTSQYVIDSQQ